MLEYKREKATLESQLKDVQKRSTDHDDHLRVIDAWWSQVNDISCEISNSADGYSCWTRSGYWRKMRYLITMPIVSSFTSTSYFA